MYVNAKLRKILHETVLSYFKWLDPFRDPDEDEKILGCAPPHFAKGENASTIST